MDDYEENTIALEEQPILIRTPSTGSIESSGEECLICFEKIKDDQLYAKMESSKEANKKYHSKCLEEWLTKSHRGILSSEQITSYDLMQGDQTIETIIIPGENKSILNNQYRDLEDDSEEESSSEMDYNNETCRIICWCFLIIIFVLGLVFNNEIRRFIYYVWSSI